MDVCSKINNVNEQRDNYLYLSQLFMWGLRHLRPMESEFHMSDLVMNSFLGVFRQKFSFEKVMTATEYSDRHSYCQVLFLVLPH